MQALIKEALPSHLKCSPDARDLIMRCCKEFITMIAAEANEECDKVKKKKIVADHLVQAFQNLGMAHYIGQLQNAASALTRESQHRPRSKRKLESLGVPMEQLKEAQQKKFAEARARAAAASGIACAPGSALSSSSSSSSCSGSAPPTGSLGTF